MIRTPFSTQFLHEFLHLLLGFKNNTSDSSCPCSFLLSNIIVFAPSPCVTISKALILHPRSFSLCVYIGLSGPPPFLSSPTLTKTYCTRTCQPVYIIALCVAVTSRSVCTLLVYMTVSVSKQLQSLSYRDSVFNTTPTIIATNPPSSLSACLNRPLLASSVNPLISTRIPIYL